MKEPRARAFAPLTLTLRSTALVLGARLAPALVLAGLGGASGCALQRDHNALVARTEKAETELDQARRDVATLRSDLEATRQRLDNALRANADGATDVMSTKQRLNDLAGRVDETQHSVEDLKKEVTASRSELYARLDELKRNQAPAPPPPVNIPPDKAAHFAQVRDAHARGDFATLRVLGPEYVNRYPQDDHADEALYYTGDADLRDGRPTSALGNFNRLLKLYPRSNVLDRTLFGMGEAYLMLHDCTNAKLAFNSCEQRYSRQKIGAESRAKLQQIARNPPGLCAP